MVLFTELTRDVCHLKFDLPWAATLKYDGTDCSTRPPSRSPSFGSQTYNTF